MGGTHDVNQTVTLSNAFGASSVQVKHIQEFCNPVKKTHNTVVAPITNPTANLTFYQFDHDAFEGGNEEPTRTVQVQNQFGTQKLTVTEAQFLAVPTQQDSLGVPTGLSHLWCWQATGNPVFGGSLTLQDQFGTLTGVTLQQPKLYCNPVQKVHGTVTYPILNTQGLVHYNVPPKGLDKHIAITNQFETNNNLQVKADRYLCVPSDTLSVTP